MEKTDLLGYEIWVCDNNEAKELWTKFPDDRQRLWTIAETWDHCLDSPEQLQKVIRRKIEKPGVY